MSNCKEQPTVGESTATENQTSEQNEGPWEVLAPG